MSKSREERKNLFEQVKNKGALNMLGGEETKKETKKPISKANQKESPGKPRKTQEENKKVKREVKSKSKPKKKTPVRNKFQILCYLSPEEYSDFDEMFMAVRKEMIKTKGVKVKESSFATMAIALCQKELFKGKKKDFMKLVTKEIEDKS